MLSKEWSHLKSGSDIRGAAIEQNGVPVELTDEKVERIAGAFAVWTAAKAGKPCSALTVSVGRDSRLSGPRIRDAVVRALVSLGVQVLDCGLSSTPAMFMTTVELACDGAVQITASHHPWHRNGLKFFRPAGGLEEGDITELLTLAQAGEFPQAAGGRVTETDYMTAYAARLRRLICDGVNAADREHPLKGFHIVVDAGNGAGGFYADQVLSPLGADITGSQFLEPDGRFPNHIPNPEDTAAMNSICKAVTAAGADLGVIFDTDVDRAGCVDAAGKELNRNRLIALAASIVLEQYPGGTVVTDSVTSDGLTQFINDRLHGVHRRFKRGYRNVINEAIRLEKEGICAPLAIETSGHAALRDNYFLDDGAYLVTQIIIKAARLRQEGRTLADVIAALPLPAESKEVRFGLTRPDFVADGNAVLTALEAYANKQGWRVAPDSCEGVRISFGPGQGEGWLLLRLSVHDPVMPLNLESQAAGGCKAMAEQLIPFLAAQTGLDWQALTECLEE